MAENVVQKQLLSEILHLVPYILEFPAERIWIDYDKEADVLYISFRRPQRATNSRMLENGLLMRYSRNELVGVTVLDASRRKAHSDSGAVAKQTLLKEPAPSYGKRKIRAKRRGRKLQSP